jgi:hypothetical protein
MLTPSDATVDHEWSLRRRQQIRIFAKHIREMMGTWADYAWASPDPGFVNKKHQAADLGVDVGKETIVENIGVSRAALTPPPEPA